MTDNATAFNYELTDAGQCLHFVWLRGGPTLLAADGDDDKLILLAACAVLACRSHKEMSGPFLSAESSVLQPEPYPPLCGNGDDIPIDPALSAPQVDPALLAGGNDARKVEVSACAEGGVATDALYTNASRVASRSRSSRGVHQN